MPSPGVSCDPRPLVAPLKQIPIKFLPFDQHHYQRLIRAREEAIRDVLHRLIPALGLKTALDAGASIRGIRILNISLWTAVQQMEPWRSFANMKSIFPGG